jgi:predicted AAA+ superfamily ATPase
MDANEYIPRAMEENLRRQIQRGKSVLLLGPRQTGKTTLIERVPADLRISLVVPGTRQRYERDPDQLLGEIGALRTGKGPRPLVVLDEIQKVPALLDVAQAAIDRRLARFILTGSSARKLRRGNVNLLPGRAVTLRLDPLNLEEIATSDLGRLLTDGSLPGIWPVAGAAERETDLESYVETYLEEEIRAEALVRNVGSFARFLELAGLESGNLVSFRALAQDLGVSHTTIAGFYEILEDCLVAERVDPLTKSVTRKKLTRSSRYLIFDMGVRRLCAREGRRLSRVRLGQLFEQLIGLELIRLARLHPAGTTVLFWRDPDGPEVDWVVDLRGTYVPIEVKWTDTPGKRDIRHLTIFLDEYPEARRAFVVCRCPRRIRLADRIDAIPWQDLPTVFHDR